MQAAVNDLKKMISGTVILIAMAWQQQLSRSPVRKPTRQEARWMRFKRRLYVT
jgi:hypothetical protein